MPTELTDAYRKACPTMRGRSDTYVGFFEVGLDLLKPGGSLAFICADRWMHNQYGASLREFVTSKFAVDAIITMHDVAAFEDDVSAYPAITVLRNDNQRVAHRTSSTPRRTSARRMPMPSVRGSMATNEGPQRPRDSRPAGSTRGIKAPNSGRRGAHHSSH